MDRIEYEKQLKKRQLEHYNKMSRNMVWRPCLHDKCSLCEGTGQKLDGSSCVHHLVCSCLKCNCIR